MCGWVFTNLFIIRKPVLIFRVTEQASGPVQITETGDLVKSNGLRRSPSNYISTRLFWFAETAQTKAKGTFEDWFTHPDMSGQTETTAGGSNSSNSSSKRKHGDDWVRKRVSQACDQCRTKKLKCDGSRPSYSTCISLSRQCFYGYAVKKRGLPEGYVRALERLLGLLLPDSGGLSALFERALEDETAKGNLIRQWNGNGSVSVAQIRSKD
jgi:hypothetical protein